MSDPLEIVHTEELRDGELALEAIDYSIHQWNKVPTYFFRMVSATSREELGISTCALVRRCMLSAMPATLGSMLFPVIAGTISRPAPSGCLFHLQDGLDLILCGLPAIRRMLRRGGRSNWLERNSSKSWMYLRTVAFSRVGIRGNAGIGFSAIDSHWNRILIRCVLHSGGETLPAGSRLNYERRPVLQS